MSRLRTRAISALLFALAVSGGIGRAAFAADPWIRTTSTASTATVTAALPELQLGGPEEPPPPPPEYGVTVRARKPVSAASSLTVRDQDFLLRPHPRPADILSVAPGLFVVQHAGGGKANQYFLRGFDADHGTDIAFSLDGVPVNLVSHGHGQGFADWHFLIPETVERVEVFKGPYFPELGDFDTAGALNLVTRKNEEHNSVSVEGGSYDNTSHRSLGLDTYRLLTTLSPTLAGLTSYVAAEYYHTNGPFIHPEGLDRVNLFAKLTKDFSASERLSLTLTGYGSGWNASGQLPQRAVDSGALDRFDAVDPSEGGNSQRFSAYAAYRSFGADDAEFNVLAYAVQYRFKLYSNFTFFYVDPVNGDEIEQDDVRTIVGAKTSYSLKHHLGDINFDTTFGAQLRSDLIQNGLHHDIARRRLDTVIDADVREGSFGLYAREEVTFTEWLRAMFGVRGDYFGFDVQDKGMSPFSGVKQAALASPKANLIATPVHNMGAVKDWDIYLNFGYGFHSNDARGVVQPVNPVTPLTRAKGYEVGSRIRLLERLDLAAALFLIDLDSEIVWDGDSGTTFPAGKTRRYGFEGEARVKILDWLFADLDLTASHAAYVENAGNGTAVALAPKFFMTAGLAARHPDGWYGRLGFVDIADRPATSDPNSPLVAEGFYRLDLTLGYRNELYDISLYAQNLTNVKWREAQFENQSRLPGETSCAGKSTAVTDPKTGAFKGCDDVHFTPGAPFNVLATATVFF
jgi:hypothetical protein